MPSRFRIITEDSRRSRWHLEEIAAELWHRHHLGLDPMVGLLTDLETDERGFRALLVELENAGIELPSLDRRPVRESLALRCSSCSVAFSIEESVEFFEHISTEHHRTPSRLERTPRFDSDSDE